MCEKLTIRLKTTRTHGEEEGRSLFVLVGSLIAALAGGRWLGLALYVSLSKFGSAFDYVNAAVALALVRLLYATASRHARGGPAALRALAILAALGLVNLVPVILVQYWIRIGLWVLYLVV